MSMSRACIEVERNPGQWYCIVANDEYDYDFHTGCNIYGPQTTPEDAFEEMHKHECNPGQDQVVCFDELTPQLITMVDTELQRREEDEKHQRRGGWQW